MAEKTKTYITDYKKEINTVNIGRMGSSIAEVLQILEQLVADRDIEGIQKFYQEVCTDTADLNDDRDPFFHNFLMQFANMKLCYGAKQEKQEPITSNHYLCFKCVYHRGEEDEFSVITFFKKRDLFQMDYKYQCFLMYNNLVGMETYLHVYEFKEPVFEEKQMVQCNNLVLSFKLEGTGYENLLYPSHQYCEDWVAFIYNRLEELHLPIRNILINGEDLTVVVDLWRTVTLKSSSLKYILGKVEKQLLIRLQDCHIYDNGHFMMVPGSINGRKHISISRKNALMFSNKENEDSMLFRREDGYYRCYYVGTDFYPFSGISLTELAGTLGFPKKEAENCTVKKAEDKRKDNKKRFTHVGIERLEDLDKLVDMRQYEISERFHFFRIMGNILFYLGKEPEEVLQYMTNRNQRLYESISENCLLRIFIFCKEDYEKYLGNPELGIKYTNKRIVELLKIRPYEQQEMKQLIDEAEAEQRIRISHIISTRKAYEPVKQEKRYIRQVKEEVIKQEFLQMKQDGMSNNEIAKKKKVDLRKVDKMVGKDQNKKQKQRELVADMTANGKTASEISEELGISVRTVRRIRAKIQQ